MSQKSFAALGVRPEIADALALRGIVRPFPIQELVVGDALAGRDVLVVQPTGSGKSACYQVPSMVLPT